jgi:RNA polymerase sigma-70 factor (sigma-E family)
VKAVETFESLLHERPVVSTPAAFEDFYSQEWLATVRLAALLTQSVAAAEDVAQDAFGRVMARWDELDNPAAYLRVAVVNECRKWHRHRRVERAKLPLLAPVDVALDIDAGLADAVAALPYRQRAVLVLRYYADLSEAEIAGALQCRPGTVKSLASRALARLHKEITA